MTFETVAPAPSAEGAGRSSAAGGPSDRMAYRPEIDGIRTVAVYLVLVFHCGAQFFSGGFIGVDVFFVLSGFLITRLLLAEWVRTGGISLPKFYARRMRRLLPAAWVTLTLGGLAVAAVLPVTELAPTGDSIRSGFLWFANWHFIGVGNDYFHTGDAVSPFLHFWSLSLEEQFYVIWPPILLGMLLLALRRGWPAKLVIGGMAVAGIALSLVTLARLSGTDPNHAYYGTDVRAYQMLAGALLAIALAQVTGKSRRRSTVISANARITAVVLQTLGLLALFVLSTSILEMGPTRRGVFATLASVALLLGIEFVRLGPSGRLLARPRMAQLGRVSYGTYLWHFPVIVIVQAKTDWPILVTVAIVALASTLLAAVSFRLVESPIRESRFLARRPGLTIAGGVSISVIGALLIPVAVASGVSLATPAGRDLTVQGLDLVSAKKDGGKAPDCLGKPIEGCLLVDSGPDAPRVAVVGDSHARSTLETFKRVAEQESWTLLAASGSGCPWQYGMLYPRAWGEQTDECAGLQKDWYERQLPEFKPDVTYLVSYSFDDPNGPQDMRPADGNESVSDQQLAKESVTRSVRALRSFGTRIAIVEPFPVADPGTNPMSCLLRGVAPSDCAYPTNGSPTDAEVVYRSLAERSDDVTTVDLDTVICPDMPRCDAVRNGYVTHRDHNHVTATYLASLERDVFARLVDSAAVPG